MMRKSASFICREKTLINYQNCGVDQHFGWFCLVTTSHPSQQFFSLVERGTTDSWLLLPVLWGVTIMCLVQGNNLAPVGFEPTSGKHFHELYTPLNPTFIYYITYFSYLMYYVTYFSNFCSKT